LLRVELSNLVRTMAPPAPHPDTLPPPGAGDSIPLPPFMAPQGGSDIENVVMALYRQDTNHLR
jgi:hypothetical protein